MPLSESVTMESNKLDSQRKQVKSGYGQLPSATKTILFSTQIFRELTCDADKYLFLKMYEKNRQKKYTQVNMRLFRSPNG